MSEALLDSQLNALRRTRSTSALPQRPEPIYSPMHSLNPSDVRDHSYLPRTAHVSPRHDLLQMPVESAMLTPPLAFPVVNSEARTSGGANLHDRPNQDVNNDASFMPDSLPRRPRSMYRKIMLALGFGREASRERRSLVGLIFNLLSGSSQIIIITIILALSGTRFKSPTDPEFTEWAACSRPLGPWACLWLIRAVIATSLNYWGFLRERHLLARRRSGQTNSVPVNSENRNRPSGQPNETGHSSPRALENADFTARDQASLPNTLLYSRLTLFSSLLTLSWFLTAHILAYTSISTCRHSSPHIWWLVFGILCLMYLMVLEVVILGFVVFVVAPILFLFWNIFLMCMGRHPLQTHNTIKPKIGKLSKSSVDCIPLVLYIPPPPDTIPQQQQASLPKSDSLSSESVPALPKPKQRFQFMKHFTSSNTSKNVKTSESKKDKDVEKISEPQTWEEYWEQGEYPFVVLEENRAACAICLVDFVEPKRIWGNIKSIKSKAEGSMNAADVPNSNVQVASISVSGFPSGSENIGHGVTKLVDAGEGTQPLRLLACGHVFHIYISAFFAEVTT
ncbi:hypothetical protein C0995_010377 [Termitomyces sp. Mi166|nr:hypothetical protein C0995_010377 [Termitomyces sp. Mi166\